MTRNEATTFVKQALRRLRERAPVSVPVEVVLTKHPLSDPPARGRSWMHRDGSWRIVLYWPGSSINELADTLIHEWSHVRHGCDPETGKWNGTEVEAVPCVGHGPEWGACYGDVYTTFVGESEPLSKIQRNPRAPAASVIVFRNQQIVGITRGRRLEDVSFPGGQPEASDASPAHTGARELLEETGIEVDPRELRRVASRHDGGHITYVAPHVRRWPAQLKSEPFEGYVALYNPDAFIQSSCTYRNHAAVALNAVGVRANAVSPKRSLMQW